MSLLKKYFFLLNLTILFLTSRSLGRQKRTLIWPQGGSKLLVDTPSAIFGFGVPVDLTPETVIVGMVIKGNYRYPTNATEITQPFVTYERRRSFNRWDLYSFLTQALDMKGLSGKSCLLKTICEVAHSPLVRNFGLFHEILHKFFTPSSTNEKINDHSDNEYFAAQRYGRKKKNCKGIFKDCPVSILDTLTILKDVI